ncbi:MAG: glycosyltransferase [Candidatus Falkowbacteria bacterium]
MKLTVAIPSYNKEKYIERCLDSVLKEKKFIDEIILIDNCSTDKSYEIAKKYEPQIVCYQNETNLGMSGNWNKCIDRCRTEWLMIFHADDEMLPGAIAKYREFISAYPEANLVHADSYSIINGDVSTKSIHHVKKKSLWKAGLDAMSCPYGACSTVMVKKDVYKKLGYFIDSSLSSDAEMWFRIASKYDIGYLGEPTIIYHINPSSTGIDSLINRSIKEIRADWDLLNKRRAEAYPTTESRDKFIQETFNQAPHAYWSVVKANIRARNYWKAFQTVAMIIFHFHGAVSLVKLSYEAITKVIKNKLRLDKKVSVFPK